ncbi:hypothetical protein SODALDRAFT_9123 [Sodiomyces alkalinus F11]|uniref:SH3 domain-containing protein n=1 Tax=Sodiomyces alkalinus (strain CBS 110278 / VKM F-3762 / F11) TaxID=1314773 RepID=A0A3N2Q5W6_SODAK|nr:hypothetical protein SODALDRAFT_9123 [Sodiomyces alkalinus F11]ROT42174.1 hypothetical protein SODALDRAFT_9123 [Sodiomyces alkalinus F11]
MARHHNHRHPDMVSSQRNRDLEEFVVESWREFNRRRQSTDDEEEDSPRGATTIVRTVIHTMSPTFTGEIAGYRTLGDDEDTSTTTTQTPSTPTTVQSLAPPVQVEQPTTTDTTSTSTSSRTTTTIPSVISEPTRSSVAGTLAVDTNTPVLPPTPTRTADSERIVNIPASASSEPSAAGEGSGTSAATTAGIVIGVLAGLLFIGLAAFLLFRRRKKQLKHQQMTEDDEKANPPFVSVTPASPPSPTTRSDPRAPRLSLRPVTQLFPNFNFDKRASKGANIALSPAAAAAGGVAAAPGLTPWDRPMTSESTDPNNPFGQQAERVPSPVAEDPFNPPAEKPLPPGPSHQFAPAAPQGSPATDSHAITTDNATTATSAASVTAAGVAAAAVAAGTLTRKASTRNGGPKAVDLTLPPPLSEVPPSPAGTEFSINSEGPGQSIPHSTSAAAIAAAGGPANSTVHRAQLDFKPTLEDEMELRAGQLVRLLHEYDDGWALCIRLDRSQQGVVPRTCLSTRPVKPRPQNSGPRGPPGPPRGPGPHHHPGQRPMPGPHGPHGPYSGPPRSGPGSGPQSPMRPMQGPGRPASPAGRRPASPSSARGMSPGPRYQGPPGPRPQSPSGTGRSQSPAGVARNPQPTRMSPTGSPPQQYQQPVPRAGPPTGPVERKPLPGQAL